VSARAWLAKILPGGERIAGKVAVVTGSARGIGLATAALLAERGAKVVLSDVLDGPLAQAEQELRSQTADVLARRCDVSNPRDCADLVAATRERFGRLDVLVNNAGVSIVAPFADHRPETCRRLVEVNLLGSIYASLAALPELERARGHLVFVASVSGIRAIPSGALYSASKAAVRSLAESLRVELRPKGVHVGVVSPGFTTSDEDKTVMRGDGSPRPIHRPAHDTPEGVARAILGLIEGRERERILTPLGQLTATLQRLSPALLDRILERRELES
jgi:NAD(P)-dependent dehydrogenase (short-subunit alcohol dehydrogenase family)